MGNKRRVWGKRGGGGRRAEKRMEEGEAEREVGKEKEETKGWQEDKPAWLELPTSTGAGRTRERGRGSGAHGSQCFYWTEARLRAKLKVDRFSGGPTRGERLLKSP